VFLTPPLPRTRSARSGADRMGARGSRPQDGQNAAVGVPAFKVRGKTIAGFAAFKNHLSYSTTAAAGTKGTAIRSNARNSEQSSCHADRRSRSAGVSTSGTAPISAARDHRFCLPVRFRHGAGAPGTTISRGVGCGGIGRDVETGPVHSSSGRAAAPGRLLAPEGREGRIVGQQVVHFEVIGPAVVSLPWSRTTR
jgi:hypothetical protein